MEDLIKEEEFIRKEYNPWPYFKVFYIIIPVCGFLTFIITIFPTGGLKSLFNDINTLLPIILGCSMIFSRKRNVLLPLAIIIRALFYLAIISHISYLFFNILEALNYGIDVLFYMDRMGYGLTHPFIYFVICMIIILPVRTLIKNIFS